MRCSCRARLEKGALMRKALVITLGAALIALAFVAAACGTATPGASSAAAPVTAGGMTAAQILTRAQHAMSKVTSASFAADVTFKMSSSGSSAQAALLGQAPITLHVAGKAGGAKKSSAADIHLTLQVAGQHLAYGVKESDKRVWVEYQGKWYVSPATKSSVAGSSKSSGTTGASLGIDPADWAASSTVTAEQLNGVKVYHITTTADTAKVMSDLVKALNAPGLAKSAGSGASALNQLKGSAQLKSLEKALASASVQYWVDASTFLVQKGTIDAKLKLGGATAASGVSGLGIDIGYSLSHFGAPVKVTPPKHALPLKSLTNSLSPLASGAGVGL
jgi:hypothetical protein